MAVSKADQVLGEVLQTHDDIGIFQMQQFIFQESHADGGGQQNSRRRGHSPGSKAHGRGARTTDQPVIDVGHIIADTLPRKFGFDQLPATQTHRLEFVAASSERKIGEARRENS